MFIRTTDGNYVNLLHVAAVVPTSGGLAKLILRRDAVLSFDAMVEIAIVEKAIALCNSATELARHLR